MENKISTQKKINKLINKLIHDMNAIVGSKEEVGCGLVILMENEDGSATAMIVSPDQSCTEMLWDAVDDLSQKKGHELLERAEFKVERMKLEKTVH